MKMAMAAHIPRNLKLGREIVLRLNNTDPVNVYNYTARMQSCIVLISLKY